MASGIGGAFSSSAPKSELCPFCLSDKDARRARQSAFDLGEQRRARLAETIARAGFDERFENFPVHRPAIHPLAQIGKRGEFPAFVPRLQNRFHRDFADAFDGGQAETDGLVFPQPRLVRARTFPRSHERGYERRLA